MQICTSRMYDSPIFLVLSSYKSALVCMCSMIGSLFSQLVPFPAIPMWSYPCFNGFLSSSSIFTFLVSSSGVFYDLCQQSTSPQNQYHLVVLARTSSIFSFSRATSSRFSSPRAFSLYASYASLSILFKCAVYLSFRALRRS